MILKRLSRGLTTVFTVIFTVVLGLTALAYQAEADVNQILGTSSYEIVQNEGAEETDTRYFKQKTSSIDEFMQQKLDIIEQVTDEGTVLLKNEKSALPLAAGARVTLFGRASYNSVYGGDSGNAQIGNLGNQNINWTFRRGLEEAGFAVNDEKWNFYAQRNIAYNADPSAEVAPDQLPMGSVSGYADAGIVVFSRVTGEGGDAADGYYELTQTELDLVAAAKEACGKVIVIINSPSPIAIHALKEDAGVGAILQIGGLGAQIGRASCRERV